MQAVNNVAASVEQVANDLTIGDLGRALRAGLADFLARLESLQDRRRGELFSNYSYRTRPFRSLNCVVVGFQQ